MGETTGISWTDSTINCWHGCDKVDTLCKHCYAEVSTPVRVKRAGGLEVWGPKAARSETKSWRTDLRKWNRAALASGKVHRVFGQSLSDTFEDYHGGRVVFADGSASVDTLDGLRAMFFGAIEAAPALTFQLLTKRPENVCRMVPASWLEKWPAHVQIGTSVGDQTSADRRIPHLLRVPAAVRFLSVEPQVGPVDLDPPTCPTCCGHDGIFNGDPDDGALFCREHGDEMSFGAWLDPCASAKQPGISWVIQGGESGSKARPFDISWARSMRDQCRAAGVPYFLKQLGAKPAATWDDLTGPGWPKDTKFWQRMPGATLHEVQFADSHGGNEFEWPEDLRGCRAFPEARGGR